MRKILCIVISVCMLLIICSCNKPYDADTSSLTNSQNASQDKLLDFTEKNYQGITKSNIFAQDDNIYYLKEKVSSKEQKLNFETFEIDVKDSCGNKILYFTYMDDKYGYYERSDEEANTTGEIGRVDIENNTYEKLIEIPVGNQSGPITASKDYLVWAESLDKSNWGLTRLNIYNFEEKTNKVFYSHSIDPNTGRCYGWNNVNCVIDGELIYFDDMVSEIVEKENTYINSNIYSYNVKTGKVNLVKEMAKRPIKIREGIIWEEQDRDDEKTEISLYKNNTVSNFLTFMNDSSRITVSGQNDSIVIKNHLSSRGGDAVDCSGVQIYNNNKLSQLLVTKKVVNVEKTKTDGNIILFSLNTDNKHKPIMFDIKADKFIELECEKSKYITYISDSYAFFFSEIQDKLQIIRIEL